MAEIKEQLSKSIEINNQAEGVVERPNQVEHLKDLQAESGPVPREVKNWMEKLETGQKNDDTTVVDDNTGQKVLTTAAPSDPKIELPIDRQSFTGGFNKPISDVGRWLSEFVLRFIKVKEGNVKFKEE
ncbi:MAG: hypothetical protein WCG91_01510 [Candidatus Shapirobacteria bacterium]